jgi:hypothetical protein
MLLMALGISVSDLRTECPVCIASTGHSKVMIGIHDIVSTPIKSHMELLKKVSKMIGCNGFFYVFTYITMKKCWYTAECGTAIGINEKTCYRNVMGVRCLPVHFGIYESNTIYFLTVMQAKQFIEPENEKCWFFKYH